MLIIKKNEMINSITILLITLPQAIKIFLKNAINLKYAMVNLL